MIALAILALALVAVLQGQHAALQHNVTAKNVTIAGLLAQDKMGALRAGTLTDLEAEAEEFPGFRYRAEMSPSPFPGVEQLQVTVSWRTGARQEAFTLALYRYRDGLAASPGQPGAAGGAPQAGGAATAPPTRVP